MIKLNHIKSVIALSATVISLAACSAPSRPATRYEDNRQASSQDNRQSRQSSERARTRESDRRCDSCGVVSSIHVVEREGRGTGVGAVIGGLIGGVAGRQVGGGTGRDVATVAGVIGGAVVGNKIEENRNDDAYYEITVDMENGGRRTVSTDFSAGRGIGVGSRVTVYGDNIELR